MSPWTRLPIAIGGVLWAACLAGYLFVGRPVTGDSIAYIDAARSIVEGRGAAVRAVCGLSDEGWLPLGHWPPGYPLSIAGFLLLGVPPVTAGVAAAALMSVGCVLVGLWIAYRLEASWLATLAILAVASMHDFLTLSATVWSDAQALFLSLLSLALFMNAGKEDGSSQRWIIGSGVCAGLAFATRWAALALPGAAALWCLLALLSPGMRRDWRGAVAWAGGWAAVAGPVTIRNLVLFRRPLGYSMPGGHTPLEEALASIGHAVVKDVTTSARLADRLPGPWPVALVLGGLLILSWLRLRRLRGQSEVAGERSPAVTILVLWSWLYLSMLLLACTRYQWGEVFESRLLVPLYVVALLVLPPLVDTRKKSRRLLVALALALLFLVQLRAALLRVSQPSPGRERFDLAEVRRLSSLVTDDRVVMTDDLETLRFSSDLNARYLSCPGPELITPTSEELERAGMAGVLWGLALADTDHLSKGVESLLGEIERQGGFRSIALRPHRLLLRYVGPMASDERVMGPELTPGPGVERAQSQ